MKPEALLMAVNDRKCVVGMNAQKHMPAAFVVSMQFRYVMAILPRLKIYKPQTKKTK